MNEAESEGVAQSEGFSLREFIHVFGHENEREELTAYEVLALPLAVASGVCARWRQVPWVTDGRDG